MYSRKVSMTLESMTKSFAERTFSSFCRFVARSSSSTSSSSTSTSFSGAEALVMSSRFALARDVSLFHQFGENLEVSFFFQPKMKGKKEETTPSPPPPTLGTLVDVLYNGRATSKTEPRTPRDRQRGREGRGVFRI